MKRRGGGGGWGACLRFKASSQLARGHSTCGELPKKKKKTSYQPSSAAGSLHPRTVITPPPLPHLLMEVASIRFQNWLDVSSCLFERSQNHMDLRVEAGEGFIGHPGPGTAGSHPHPQGNTHTHTRANGRSREGSNKGSGCC